jgi:hypothetical protein
LNKCDKFCSPKTCPGTVDKQKIKRLLTFRIIKEKLLYVIGIPKRFADERLLSKQEYCG